MFVIVMILIDNFIRFHPLAHSFSHLPVVIVNSL